MVDRHAVGGHAQARARRAQAAGELDRLEREIAAWVRVRGDLDRLRQYATPLATLERTLLGALRALREELQALAADEPPGAVYAGCRRVDRQAAIVRQVWAWFRAKFDQRDDDTLSGLLAAADEVVWSCYREAVESAALRGVVAAERWPVPLPYVEPSGTVEAVVRGAPPPSLTPGADQPAVRAFLASLPVPVIGLPAACLDAPWWLTVIGHEVGHHLQHDLAADAQLLREVGEAVERAAGPAWRPWSQEVFADACAVASLGTGGITAVLHLELDTEPRLLARRPQYPPAVVRLALLAEIADRLGLDGTAALEGLDPAALTAPRDADALAAARAAARADLAQVGGVADAVLTTPLGGAGPLPRLFRFDPADHRPGGRVTAWADAVLSGAARPDHTLRAPREQLAGAALAWRRAIAVADDAERAATLARLAGTLPPLVAASRQPGVRAAGGEPAPQDLSPELTAALHAAVGEPGEPQAAADRVGA